MVPSGDLEEDIFKRRLRHTVALNVHSLQVGVQCLEEGRILFTEVLRKLEDQFINIIDSLAVENLGLSIELVVVVSEVSNTLARKTLVHMR